MAPLHTQLGKPSLLTQQGIDPYWAEELRSRHQDRRLYAVKRLAAMGSEAQEVLAIALKDRDPEIRIAAAQALGEHGDERSIPPLLEALRGSFLGRSSRVHLALGVFVAALFCLFVMLRFTVGLDQTGPWKWLGSMFVPAALWGSSYFDGRRRASRVKELSSALLQIAERHPSPQVATAVAELKLVARDVLQQDKETRQTSREVAARLEALTEQIKSLPVASGPLEEQERTLPRPAATPEENIERLPRVCS